MASSQLIPLPNTLSVSSLLTIEKGAFQRESCCASALSNESIEAKRLYLIYNGGFHLHQLVGPYASLFLAKGQDRRDKLRQEPTSLAIKIIYLPESEHLSIVKITPFHSKHFKNNTYVRRKI